MKGVSYIMPKMEEDHTVLSVWNGGYGRLEESVGFFCEAMTVRRI